EDLQNSKAKVETPEEEGPLPKVVNTPDIMYARFLGAFKKPLAKGELRKFQAELKDLAAKPEFEVAHADINADLDDLTKAQAFEQEVMKAKAAAGGTIELGEEFARKFGASKGKIAGYEPGRGLSVDISSERGKVTQYIGASDLPLDDRLKLAPDKSPAAQVSYLLARGYQAEADDLLKTKGAGLKPELLARYQRKLRLLKSGELELRAEAAFENLAKAAEAKHWRTYAALGSEFEKRYGTTTAYNDHIVALLEWKAAAKLALVPPEGLETNGKFTAVRGWPNVNGCTSELVVDREGGNKVLRIESKVGGEDEKSAVMRTDAPPINLTNKTKLLLRARIKADHPLRLAFGFMFGVDEFYESQPVAAPTGGWAELSIPIDGPVFKCKKTKYVNYDSELPTAIVPNLFILIYTKDPFLLEICGITFR
ncbi:MAG: hypothetical protein ABSE73_09940, partial [Planctomycetota bacterium]